MNHPDPRWMHVFNADWTAHILLAVIFWIGLIWVCLALRPVCGFRSLRWLGAYCGLSALSWVATFAGRIVRLPPSAIPFSWLLAARVVLPTVLTQAERFLVAIIILSEIASLLQRQRSETESKLISVLSGINRQVEAWGLILVCIATISFGLHLLFLAGY